MYVETKKADRVKMADEVQALATRYGFPVKRIEPAEGWPGRRCIRLEIETLRGLCVSVDFDGNSSQPDVYVIPWYISGHKDTKISHLFGYVAGGSVNSYHCGKCTAVQRGWDALIDSLESCFEEIQDGIAFQDAKDGI